MPESNHDRLALALFGYELRDAIRSVRKRDLAWIVFGGGFLLLNGIGNVVVYLRSQATGLRSYQTLWAFEAPIALFVVGLILGSFVARLAIAQAFAPFLKALPLSQEARLRTIRSAVIRIGAGMALATLGIFAAIFVLIGHSGVLIWAGVETAAFAGGLALGAHRRMARVVDADIPDMELARKTPPSVPLPGLRRLDGGGGAWMGSWAWRLVAGRLPVNWRLVLGLLVFGVLSFLAIGASLARHEATPAVAIGLAGGLGLFMLSLRCHPLASPVLRTAPVSFGRAWLRLLRLPLILSATFFALPAGAAWAAEPSAWVMPVGGGLALLVLNAAYGVFAAYFLSAPFVAAAAFLGAIAYANYETFEWGRTAFLGVVGLMAFLWFRARQRYYDG